MWVIVDRLTKSAHLYRIGIPGSRLSFGGVSRGPWDTDEDEHSVSSVDKRTVKEDYPGFEGHAVSMRHGLQGWLG